MVSNINKQEQTNETVKIAAKILVLFGTRPEVIKLAPIVSELKNIPQFQTLIVSSSQHTDLLEPFLKIFELETDYDLKVMTDNQTPNQVLARTVDAFDKILADERPDLILVQGDTTTTLAGAMTGFNRDIAVGHVEAGLRTGNLRSPFPEEMNRRLTSQLATFHFAPTFQNRQNLLKEHISEKQIYVTGNTIVDALRFIRQNFEPSEGLKVLLKRTSEYKRVLLTTHRRESFRKAMRENLLVLREFIEKRKDTCLIFPVHPNPNVRDITDEFLLDRERIFLLEPLGYIDFISLMENAWLIASDSGGVQEEAPTLGKPVLILRDVTERPEAVRCGIAKLVGGNSRELARLLDENYLTETWIKSTGKVQNPFGDGESAERIVKILLNISQPISAEK
jgi:UDP-N-acetylglucosamine 2-epimerase (non-hydrolysing)